LKVQLFDAIIGRTAFSPSSARVPVAPTKTLSWARREQPCDLASRDTVPAHDADDDRVIQHLAKRQF
jgi:hypothetical protein